MCQAQNDDLVISPNFEITEEMIKIDNREVKELKLVELARRKFYWPRMQNHVEFLIKCNCMIAKKPNVPERVHSVPIKTTFPF